MNIPDSANITVRISYQGEFYRTVATGDSTRSANESGTVQLDVPDDPGRLAVNAQKRDESSKELVVQILADGEVVAEASTTHEYGSAHIGLTDQADV